MTLRELIIDWLTASRYVKWLESRHYETRQDYETRLGEKDTRIKDLRYEVERLRIECDRLHVASLERGSQAGADYPQLYRTDKPPVRPEFTAPDDWSSELNRMYDKEMQDVIRGEGRQEVNQSSADDGAQPFA